MLKKTKKIALTVNDSIIVGGTFDFRKRGSVRDLECEPQNGYTELLFRLVL